jgi:hypothetical protein
MAAGSGLLVWLARPVPEYNYCIVVVTTKRVKVFCTYTK